MNIIAHRGLWKEKIEQNSYQGIKKALDFGFGVELDVREKNGELIISHDPSNGNEILLFQEVLDLFTRYDSILAINVKCDGILATLKPALAKIDNSNYFLFDMSIPETIAYLESGLTTFMRLSEYESYCKLHTQSDGIWLDAFQNDWWKEESKIFKSVKKICVVSPELHGREKTDAWEFLKSVNETVELYICTDYPESAKKFFG